jgi:hypothetical protein
MVENVEQHQVFQNGLETLRDYSAQMRKTPSVYEANKIVIMIRSFGHSFCLHLHEEIDTLTPHKLRTVFPDQRDLKKTHIEMIRWKISHATKTTMLPWVFNFTERSDGPDFVSPRGQDRAMLAD